MVDHCDYDPRGFVFEDGWTYEPPALYETNSSDGPETAVRVAGIVPTAASVGEPSLSVVQGDGE